MPLACSCRVRRLSLEPLGEISPPNPLFLFPTARAVGSGFLGVPSSPPPACLGGLKPLRRLGMPRTVRPPPPCQAVFCLFAGPIFAVGEFSTTAPAQLQVFLKTTGYYREGPETLGNLRGCGESARPFQRKSATVSAQKHPQSATVSARITFKIPCFLWIRLAYAFPQKGGRKKRP